MKLLDSLLDAIVRLEGDALVMHVGEKPYVVTTSASMSAYRGPLAWGQVELSSRVLTADAVQSMLGQILPADQRQSLDELGAIEHEIAAPQGIADRFTVVAARGGDDIWLELRRTPNEVAEPHIAAAEPALAEQHAVVGEPAAVVESASSIGVQEPPAEPPIPERTIDTDAEEPLVSHDAAEAAADHVEHEEQLEVGPIAEIAEIEERVPVLDEVSQHHPEHIEHVVISVGGPGNDAHEHVALDSVPNDAIEVVDDEAQGVPSDEEVDAMLAATASALLTSDLPSEEEAGDTMSLESMQVVDEEVEEPEHAAAPAQDHAAPELVETPVVVEPSVEEPVAAHEEVAFELVAQEPVTHEHEEVAQEEREEEEPVAIVSEQETLSFAGLVEEEAPAPVRAPEFVVPDTAAAAWAVPPVQHETSRIPVSESLPGLHGDHGAMAPGSYSEPHHSSADARHGVVVPLARRADGSASPAAALVSALRTAAARGATTVYLVAQSKPVIRANGEIIVLDQEAALTAADIERLVADLAPQRRAGGADDQLEWMSDVPEVGRVRCLTFRDHRGPGVIFRMDQVALAPEVKALLSQHDGLVLVAGPHASGKSTLLNAFVDQVNVTRGDHVITLETQVGFVHESRRSFISQREVGEDAAAAAAAARAALREDPDVLVLEDLRSPDVVAVALEAAESGRLVFASVSAPSGVAAIEQLLAAFPPERRARAARSLGVSLRGIVSQVLVRRAHGGRMPAREVMFNTPAVAGMIRDGRTDQLSAALESGRAHGMMSMTESLLALVREGLIQPVEAYRKATDRVGLLARLKQEGVDTSFADRLV